MRAIQGHQDYITVLISNALPFSEVCVCLLFILSSRVQITDSSLQFPLHLAHSCFLYVRGLQTKSNPHQQRKILRVLVKWDDFISIHDQRKVNGTRGFGWYQLPNYLREFVIEDHPSLFVRMA